MKTELKNRTLWFDGTSQVAPELVPELLLEGVKPGDIVVNETNDDIALFNSLSDELIEFGKVENRPFDMSYRIPKEFQEFNWENHLQEKLLAHLKASKLLGTDKQSVYIDRLLAEIKEIQVRNMSMLIRTLMYVVDTLKKKEIFWGVGRGSSCASLTLFILGLHKVDPIRFNIPMSEFFHD